MPDIFDRISIEDIFDRIDLPVEQKVAFSEEMADLVREELRKEIAKIPVGKMIAQMLNKEVAKQERSAGVIKESLTKDIAKTKADIGSQVTALKNEIDEFMEKMRKKYADLKNEMLSQPAYQFGGFSPQFNDLNIGDPGANGAWRIVKSGNDLSVERLESGSWVQKGVFTA